MNRAGLSRAWLAAVVFAAACGALPTPRSCSAASDCPPGALCQGGTCVADRPPAAEIALPGTLVSNLPLVFDGGGSSDPDAGDRVASWQWTVKAVTAACDPDPGSATGQKLTVVFPCAGDFDVSLVVLDSAGAASAPAAQRVTVALSTDPPAVAAGSDRTLDHRCSGTPVQCTPWDGSAASVALTAQASGPEGVTFSYHWTAALPPELAAKPAPSVSFSPGPDVASPSVLIETAGTAIAGRYTFTVEATDSRGMVAVGRQGVTVGNRPPVVSGGGTLEIPHVYQAASNTFTATGTTPSLAVVDPDGDPISSLGFAFSHAGDGSAVFAGQDQGDHATVTVTVPFTTSSSAALLIGPTVVRRADLTVVDANGASATGGFAIVVGNSPPRLVTPVAAASVHHSFDAAGSRYLASAPLSTWVDDDGDPLTPSASGDPLCSAATSQQGTAWVTCALPYAGAPAVGSFAGLHTVTVVMADPFSAGTPQATAITVLNRAPRLLATQANLPAACTSTPKCCESDGGTCTQRDVTFGAGSATVSLVADDDGDPVALLLDASGCLSASAGEGPCPASGCPVALSLCSVPSQCLTVFPSASMAVTASDGLDSVQGTVQVNSVCQ
ncbi:MAG TPA: hypothetical protein VMK42_02435 [Anaeromyxobacteraceae bacterium]|nr:hypothetical protein [Anaeromyxobacteraceae bacterium]